ncbi:MAG: hypothetical protein KIT11_10040 [Fimbriimonadaceae bacterium]|nr:hypothetical protein [Fimbriimonadaceae bacterium]QYK55663.1 MAG: hypothetical protein KF733_11710 [Fimbriimonadaceae bacterium]
MEWQATDQFGNLYVAESDAQSLEELRPHIASLVNEVRERAGDSFRITLDMGYQELNGPDPDNVSHVLRVPWFAGQPKDETTQAVEACVREAFEACGATAATFGAC